MFWNQTCIWALEDVVFVFLDTMLGMDKTYNNFASLYLMQGTTQSPASQTPLALEYSTGTTPTQPSFGASSKTSFVGGQPSREDAKVDGRKELPTVRTNDKSVK